MLLDIAKLLLDKETRESFKEVIAFLKKKPEWKKDLVEMAERFERPDEPKARLFVQFSAELLVQKEWQPGRAGIAEFAMQEIVDNAFAHGISHDDGGTVRIRTLLSSAWVRCRVTDSGAGFSLEEKLKAQTSSDQHRGLWTVKEMASSLLQDGPNAIEVTIDSTPGQIAVSEVRDGVYLVSLTGQLRGETFDHSAELAKIDALVAAGATTVLDLTDATYADSRALRFMMVLKRQLAAKHCRTILVTGPSSRLREILQVSRITALFECVDTVALALALSGDTGVTEGRALPD